MAEEDRIRWNAKYRRWRTGARRPDPFLVEVAETLPVRGRALDVAGGAGLQALWLAARGLDVTLSDISEVGLTIAEAEAERQGLPLTTLRRDLEEEPLPAGPWEVILCRYFLWRPLFAVFPSALAPGGHLIFVHPTRSDPDHARPGGRYLLADSELPALLAGLEVIRCEQGWAAGGQLEVRVLARRRPDSP